MKLRCWPGCTAAYVGRDPSKHGRTDLCIELCGVCASIGEAAWVTEPNFLLDDGSPALAIADYALMPITPRDNDIAADEVAELYAPTVRTKEPV